MVLYIEACAREDSRTRRLAAALLDRLGACEKLDLYETPFAPMDRQRLDKRTALIEQSAFGDEMFAPARQFARAETIVIAAPYWDLAFPSALKLYLENIYVTGIVSRYDENGVPVGLCAAKKLYYVTTAGGPYDPAFSYDYLRSLAKDYFGIPETRLIMADMLDVWGVDAEARLNAAIGGIEL